MSEKKFGTRLYRLFNNGKPWITFDKLTFWFCVWMTFIIGVGVGFILFGGG